MCMQRPIWQKNREKSGRPNGIGGVYQSEEEALGLLRESGEYQSYLSLTDQLQNELLSFVMGNRGLRILYDPFFKKIFDPVLHPERLSRLLSLILGQKVEVKQILPQESRRLSAKASLIIMDIVVELEDGSYANVEIQKVGYDFPGQRSSCYSSDLIMRQYDMVRSIHGKKFSYRKLKRVYTIVLMENSSNEFYDIPNAYVHHSRQVFDTGLKLELLQEYVFVALDIFKENVHNISNELDAWLCFLSSDRPEDMRRMIEAYPGFLELYKEIAEFQKKPEELIRMFSEALAIMDKNTVELMVEEQKKEIRRHRKEIQAQHKKLESQNKEIESQNREIESQNREIESQNREIESQNREIESQNKEIESQNKEIESRNKEIESRNKEIELQEQEIDTLKREAVERERELERLRRELASRR